MGGDVKMDYVRTREIILKSGVRLPSSAASVGGVISPLLTDHLG